jgi:hypothetical protein
MILQVPASRVDNPGHTGPRCSESAIVRLPAPNPASLSEKGLRQGTSYQEVTVHLSWTWGIGQTCHT